MWKTREFADAARHFGIALVTPFVKKADVKPELMGECGNRTPSRSRQTTRRSSRARSRIFEIPARPVSIANPELLKEGHLGVRIGLNPGDFGPSGSVRSPMADG